LKLLKVESIVFFLAFELGLGGFGKTNVLVLLF